MPTKLSALLVQDRVVGFRQMDEAVQRQQDLGGRIGTNLLELGYIDADVLLYYVGKQRHIPALTDADLDDIDPDAVSAWDADQAVQLMAVPISVDRRRLRVAVVDPLPDAFVKAFEQRSGLQLEQAIVLEFRMWQALGRIYGVDVPERYAALAERHPVAVGTRDPRLSATGAVPIADAAIAEPAPGAPEFDPDADVIPGLAWNGEQLTTFFRTSTNRDHMLLAALGFVGKFFPRRMLHVVTRTGLKGYAIHMPGQPKTPIDEVEIDVPDDSTLGRIIAGGSYYYGPLEPSGAAPLYDGLGIGRPPDVCIVPVQVGPRAILVMTVDAGDTAIEPQTLPITFLAVNRLSAGLARLIRRIRIRRSADYAAVGAEESLPDRSERVRDHEAVDEATAATAAAHRSRLLDDLEQRRFPTTSAASVPQRLPEDGWDFAILEGFGVDEPIAVDESADLGDAPDELDARTSLYSPVGGNEVVPEQDEATGPDRDDGADQSAETSVVERTAAPIDDDAATTEAVPTREAIREPSSAATEAARGGAKKETRGRVGRAIPPLPRDDTPTTESALTTARLRRFVRRDSQPTAPTPTVTEKLSPLSTPPEGTATDGDAPDRVDDPNQVPANAEDERTVATSDDAAASRDEVSGEPESAVDEPAEDVATSDEGEDVATSDEDEDATGVDAGKAVSDESSDGDDTKKVPEQDSAAGDTGESPADDDGAAEDSDQAPAGDGATESAQVGFAKMAIVKRPVQRRRPGDDHPVPGQTAHGLRPLEDGGPATEILDAVEVDLPSPRPLSTGSLAAAARIYGYEKSDTGLESLIVFRRVPSDSSLSPREGGRLDPVDLDVSLPGVVQPSTVRDPRSPNEQALYDRVVGASNDELIGWLLDDDDRLSRASFITLLDRGERAHDALIACFPGPLVVNRSDPHAMTNATAIERHGPVVWLVALQLRSILPRIGGLAGSEDADARYYACRLLQQEDTPLALEAMGDRLFDADPQVRDTALSFIERRVPASSRRDHPIVVGLRRRLSVDDTWVIDLSLAALQKLRDDASIPAIIALLERPSEHTRQRAAQALVHLTFQDFGVDARRWRKWFERHGRDGHHTWLLDAMIDKDWKVRDNAARELRSIPRLLVNYRADLDKKGREVARRAVHRHFYGRDGGDI